MNTSNYQDILITETEAAQLAKEYYLQKEPITKKLPGYEDFNFHLNKGDDKELILKISRPDGDLENWDLQNKIVQHLGEKSLSFSVPHPILNKNGNFIESIKDRNGQARFMRLLSWLDGKVWINANPYSPELLDSLGNVCGQLCNGLEDFDHPAAHKFFDWNPSEWNWLRENVDNIRSKEQKEIADYYIRLFKEEIQPVENQLRKSVIHSDLNEFNIIVSKKPENRKVTGIIDYGDAMFSHTINELAIVCAYVLMYMPDPIEAAKHIIKNCHEVFRLTELEIKLLYHFIAARLLVSVTHSAISRIEEPENEYRLISEKSAWNLLKKWRKISPSLANYHFRSACGFEINPKKKIFEKWANENKDTLYNIISLDLAKTRTLDLSVGSLDLGLNENFEETGKFSKKINNLLVEKDAEFGVGGYGEVRPIYTTDDYLVKGNNGPEWRTVHIGLDIWGKAGVPVFAPLDGKVFANYNNVGERNYGYTLILEHSVSEALTFYTLYGHLALQVSKEGAINLENQISANSHFRGQNGKILQKGDLITKGQRIATIGVPPENGNWPPHLHFQIILDMLDWENDFPGVAFPKEKEVWLNICPNPVHLFPELEKLNFQKEQLGIKEILDYRKQNLGKGLSTSYKKPLHILRASNQYLYDIDGRRYLDTVNNVPHVGHQHSKVVKAAQKQIAILNTNTRYLHEEIIKYAEELLATFPPELCVVHFVNSGSEANELAIRMAKTISNQKDMIAIEVGYHGNSNACVDVSSYKFDGKGGKGAPLHTHVLPIPDDYRGLYKRGESNIGEKYAGHIEEIIEKVGKEGRGIAGFIGESILSCGGQIVLPENYLTPIYNRVWEAGGICIADEVQIGFGRVGDTFWGFQLQKVIPDIVVLGKPIGNGHPIGAVVCTRKVADAFANGMEYFSTFGGNPVSCSIGRAVLNIVLENDLQRHAKEVGGYLKNELVKLQKEFPIIGDVRGHGLFLGFELVESRETKTPAAEKATRLINRMRDKSILMSTDGPFYNVIKIKPPMCFDKKDVDFLIKMLKETLEEDRFLID